MPLLSNYQKEILESFSKYDFRTKLFKGACHDALIGELINWWLNTEHERLIVNPATMARMCEKRVIGDLLFYQKSSKNDEYLAMGIAEVENNVNKFNSKINTLHAYEKYCKKGKRVYPDLEFAIFCYKIMEEDEKTSNDVEKWVMDISNKSDLLYLICEIPKTKNKELRSELYSPNNVKGADTYYYTRNIDGEKYYSVKRSKIIY